MLIRGLPYIIDLDGREQPVPDTASESSREEQRRRKHCVSTNEMNDALSVEVKIRCSGGEEPRHTERKECEDADRYHTRSKLGNDPK